MSHHIQPPIRMNCMTSSHLQHGANAATMRGRQSQAQVGHRKVLRSDVCHRIDPAKGEEDVACLYCGETFKTSREVWIQFAMCKDWAHKACASHEVGEFVCELCDE